MKKLLIFFLTVAVALHPAKADEEEGSARRGPYSINFRVVPNHRRLTRAKVRELDRRFQDPEGVGGSYMSEDKCTNEKAAAKNSEAISDAARLMNSSQYVSERRFSYIRYDEVSVAKGQDFKKLFVDLATKTEEQLSNGRAKALVLTKLEEAYMWIGKAIRDEQMSRTLTSELTSNPEAPERGE